MNNLELELYPQAMKLWGEKNQADIMLEELAELSVATHHLYRNYKNKTELDKIVNMQKFIGELADVQITTNCMIYHFNIFQEVEKEKMRKLVRLSNLINEGAEH